MKLATIFFLPLQDRPKEYPPLENFRGKFWHTGIILKNKGRVYECFNKGKWDIASLEKLTRKTYKNKILIKNIPVNTRRLTAELKSGTDCAEYVARCTGLSKLTGAQKGQLYPEDVYNLLLKILPPLSKIKN